MSQYKAMIYYPLEQMERLDQKAKKEWATVWKQLIRMHVRPGQSLTVQPRRICVYKVGLTSKAKIYYHETMLKLN